MILPVSSLLPDARHLHDTLAQLELVNQTPAKEYSIYRIP